MSIPGNSLHTLATGIVKLQDHPPVARLLKQKIRRYGRVTWLWQARRFKYWTPGFFVINGLFFILKASQIDKLAIVGDQKRVKMLGLVLKTFWPGKLRYFKSSEIARGKRWLNGKVAPRKPMS